MASVLKTLHVMGYTALTKPANAGAPTTSQQLKTRGRENWNLLMRKWLGTSVETAGEAEQALLRTFVPGATASRVYIELERYGVQYMNTVTVKQSDQGSKTALVVTHGYGGGAGVFYRNLAAMRELEEENVFAIDWLGMGRSSRPSSGLMSYGYPQRSAFTRKEGDAVSDECIDFFVQSLELWRKAMKIDSLKLVGHSLGGYLAAKYAIKYPQRVERLVLLSPVGVPDLPSDRKEMEMSTRGKAFVRLASFLWSVNVTPMSFLRLAGPWGLGMMKNAVERRFRRAGVTSGMTEEEANRLIEYLYHINVHVPSGEYALNALLTPVLHPDKPGVYARRPLAPFLPQISAPTTFIYGDRDWMYHQDVPGIAASMPSATVERLPDAGHHVHMDNPAGFNRVLREVLAAEEARQENS